MRLVASRDLYGRAPYAGRRVGRRPVRASATPRAIWRAPGICSISASRCSHHLRTGIHVRDHRGSEWDRPHCRYGPVCPTIVLRRTMHSRYVPSAHLQVPALAHEQMRSCAFRASAGQPARPPLQHRSAGGPRAPACCRLQLRSGLQCSRAAAPLCCKILSAQSCAAAPWAGLGLDQPRAAHWVDRARRCAVTAF